MKRKIGGKKKFEIGKRYKVGSAVLEYCGEFDEPVLNSCVRVRVVSDPNSPGWAGDGNEHGWDKDIFERRAKLVVRPAVKGEKVMRKGDKVRLAQDVDVLDGIAKAGLYCVVHVNKASGEVGVKVNLDMDGKMVKELIYFDPADLQKS